MNTAFFSTCRYLIIWRHLMAEHVRKKRCNWQQQLLWEIWCRTTAAETFYGRGYSDCLLATCPEMDLFFFFSSYVLAGIVIVCHFMPRIKSYFSRNYLFLKKSSKSDHWRHKAEKKDISLYLNDNSASPKTKLCDHIMQLQYQLCSNCKIATLELLLIIKRATIISKMLSQITYIFSSSISFTLKAAEFVISPATSCFTAFNNFMFVLQNLLHQTLQSRI